MLKKPGSKILETTLFVLALGLIAVGGFLSYQKLRKSPPINGTDKIGLSSKPSEINKKINLQASQLLAESGKSNQINITDQLNEQIIEKSLALNSLDNPDELDPDELLSNLALQNPFPLPDISDETLNIDSKTTTEDYIRALSATARESFENPIFHEKDELETAIEAVASQDYQVLDAYIGAYQQSARKARLLPVPKSLLQLHKEIIANTLVMTDILRAFRNHEDDPLKTMAALNEFKAVQTRGEIIINNLISVLRNGQ